MPRERLGAIQRASDGPVSAIERGDRDRLLVGGRWFFDSLRLSREGIHDCDHLREKIYATCQFGVDTSFDRRIISAMWPIRHLSTVGLRSDMMSTRERYTFARDLIRPLVDSIDDISTEEDAQGKIRHISAITYFGDVICAALPGF